MAITITNIPRIMRRHHWINGARLMENWFSRPAATAPGYGPADTSTIQMDSWVLTFPRANQVYDQIMRGRIWVNPAAQRTIAATLRRNGFLTIGGNGTRSFGNLTRPVETLDADYINFRAVATPHLALDDMTAALGDFVFRVVVAGTVAARRPSGYLVTITEVGVYVRDSYDFNGQQFLGIWDDSGSVSSWNLASGESVWNSTFRDWRSRYGRGGDFLVFSDLKRTTLAAPDTFVIP